MTIIILLIFAGILLILAEILIIPGVGIAGILGISSMVASSYFAFNEYSDLCGCIITTINVILVIGFTIMALNAKTWEKLSLKTKIESKSPQNTGIDLSVGDTGLSLTRLSPMGTARIHNKNYEVKTIGEVIAPNTTIEVIIIEENSIIVKSSKGDF